LGTVKLTPGYANNEMNGSQREFYFRSDSEMCLLRNSFNSNTEFNLCYVKHFADGGEVVIPSHCF